MSCGGKTTFASFVVVDDRHSNLLGLNELTRLGIIPTYEDNRFVGAVMSREDQAFIVKRFGSSPTATEIPSIEDSDEDLWTKHKQTFERQTSHLCERNKNDLWKLLVKHRDAWFRPQVGKVRYQASFRVDGKPQKAKLRRMDKRCEEELKRQVEEQLKAGVIRPSKSDWASLPHFVVKKTGDLRIVLDYRRVNDQMVTDAYFIPRAWDNLQRAAGHSFYICLDMYWGFWNVPLHEDSKKFTAFVTPSGMFEFNVVPFGIKNSPGEFQRAMDSTFKKQLGKNCLCYIDHLRFLCSRGIR